MVKNVRYSITRLLLLAVLGLAGCFQVVWAVTWNENTDFHWNAGTNKITAFPGAGSGNVWATGAKTLQSTGPSAKFQKALPFGPSPYANFHAGFTPGNIAKGLSPMSAIVTLVGAAIIDQAIENACLQIGGTPQTGHFWQECNMVPVTGSVYTVSQLPQATGSTKAEACSKVILYGWIKGAMYGTDFCEIRYTSNNNYYTRYGFLHTTTTSLEKQGYKEATQAIAEQKLTQQFEAWTQADFTAGKQADSNMQKVLDAAFAKNIGLDASIWSDWPTDAATGQSLKPGDSTTVQIKDSPVTTTTSGTDANGNPTTTSKTEQTTHDYKTDAPTNPGTTTNNQINITHSTTNNIFNTSSTVINSTTVVVTSTASVTGSGSAPGEAKTDCEKYPASIGCASFGTPVPSDVLSKESVPVVITPATFSGGSCPGPVSFSAFGQSYAFAYTPLCDQLANLAPLFLALAALMSAWIFTSGFRV